MPGSAKTLVTFFLIVMIAGPINLFSQVPVTRSENKVIIEGTIYFVHIVKPGQTLYSISKAYGVTEKDIALENPGVYAGLQVGQVLKIPAELPKERQKAEFTDTTQFIIHYLQAGETVFSLSRKYNITAEAIIEANPGIDITQLSIGQKLNIPRLKTLLSEEDFNLHKVRRRETLYSISRTYGISEDEILRYNPELQWGGLKTGEVIRIPRPEFLARQQKLMEEEEIPEESLLRDSLYQTDEYSYIDSLGLSELTLEDYEQNFREFKRNKLNVAFLIPFNYSSENDTINTPLSDPVNFGEGEKEFSPAIPKSIRFLEFFEGSLLALDSLKREGVDLNTRFFDTKRSPERVREILNSPFFRDVDLIIGPFFSYNVEIVSEFSRQNKVPLISPFHEGMELTDRNPYLFQISPSYKTEYARASEILSRQYDKNFVFIYRKDPAKYPEIEFFKSGLLSELKKYNHEENLVIKEISFENPSKANLGNDLPHSFTADKKNIVIIPEIDEAFVSTVITQLFFQLQNYEIEVFGLPQFYEFQNIDFQYYHALKLNYLSPFYFDHSDSKVDYFFRQFRNNFKSEPRYTTRKGGSYALLGYDLTYYFIRQLHRWDNRFISHLNSLEIDNLLPDFYFYRNTPFGGFENQSLKLIKFQEDFTIQAEKTTPAVLDVKPENSLFLKTGR